MISLWRLSARHTNPRLAKRRCDLFPAYHLLRYGDRDLVPTFLFADMPRKYDEESSITRRAAGYYPARGD